VILGAGGIVRDAHLPAYRRARFPVRGVYDLRLRAARETSRRFGIERVYRTLDEALEERDVVLDLAVPADAVLQVIERVPERSTILIQKPLGRDLDEARRIVRVARAKNLVAAVNFQLRFAPNMLALRDLVERGAFGVVRDVEVRVVTHTPWSRWKFLRGTPRLEVLYHSIHYLDLVRSLFGEPSGVRASLSADPAFKGYADTRSSILLEYARGPRVTIHTDHAHDFGPAKKASEIKIEGTRGAAVARMAVNLDYPNGGPDSLEIASGRRWRRVRLCGSWFPDAFEGTMANLQRFAAKEDAVLYPRIDDALRTMALVETCYRASSCAPTPVELSRASRP
jgi:predicted dehydrogenase